MRILWRAPAFTITVHDRVRVLVAGVFIVLGLPAYALAQRDSTARVERVGEGAYAIIHQNATEEWPNGNTGVIVGDDAVLVVDATYLPSRARADIALIRRLTDKPVRYLVITHWHYDHTNGMVAYRNAFPGITIVSASQTARWIVWDGTQWSRMQTHADSPHRKRLAELEGALAKGVDSAGHPLSDSVRTALGTNIRQRQQELAELATLELVRPNFVFSDSLALDLGHRLVLIHDRGRAHSPEDVTVYLPHEQVLYTGDILVQSPLPFVGAGWFGHWVEVLRTLEALPVTAVIPGHGPVMHDHTYTRQMRTLLETTMARVDSLARTGLSMDQVQHTINLDDLRRAVPAWNTQEGEENWPPLVDYLVDRAWRSLGGRA